MKKYSSIKAVRPIVIVAIFVLLTILFALYSTSINPIAEDVFTALDLDDTPLADVATDVKQAEAGSMSLSTETDGSYNWSYGNFTARQEQGSISTLDVKNGDVNTHSYTISQSTGSSTKFAVATQYPKNVEQLSIGTNPLWRGYVGGSAAIYGDAKVILTYDYLLTNAMYRAILSGKYKPTLSNIKINWKIENKCDSANITPWSYIGIGYKTSSSDKTFGGYTEMWKAINVADGATSKGVGGPWDTTVQSPGSVTVSASGGSNNTSAKFLRIGIAMHIWGDPDWLSRRPIVNINYVSCNLTLTDVSEANAPTISLSTGENTTSSSLTASFKDDTALKSYSLKRTMGANGTVSEAISSATWATTHPSTNDTSAVQNASASLSLNKGYGEYTLEATDIEGNTATKKIYYFDPKISLAIKTDGAVNTSGGYVTIDAYSNGNWTTTSASSSGSAVFPAEFTVWAIVKPGYYFKGFSHDGTFNSGFNVDMQSSGTTGTYTYKNAYKNSSGGTVSKTGVFGFTFKVSSSVLTKYPSSGTITLYAEFGSISTAGVTNNQTFTYAGAGSTAIKPTIDLTKHLTVAGLSAGADIKINGTYKSGGTVVNNTEGVKYAGSFTATVALTWGSVPLGSKTINFTINPAAITVAPTFGTKTKISKVYDGTSNVIATAEWTVTVGKNYDSSALTFGLKSGKTLAYKYVALSSYGDQNFNSIASVKDCNNSLAIVACVNSNADVVNYIEAKCSDAAMMASYTISYDAQAYYRENATTFNKTSATGAITQKDVTIVFKIIDGTKVYDGTNVVTSDVSATVSGVVSGEGIGVTYNATIESKEVANNKKVSVGNIVLTTSNAHTYPISNYKISGYQYRDATNVDISGDLNKFSINITRAPMAVSYAITGTTKVYDNSTDFFGSITYDFVPGNGINETLETFGQYITATAVYDAVDAVEAANILITITFEWDDFVNYYWEGDSSALTVNGGFIATFTTVGKIEKRNIALAIGDATKYYGTYDPSLSNLVTAAPANQSAGIYDPVHRVSDIVANVVRVAGEDAYDNAGNQIKYPISLEYKDDAFINNYNINVTNGTFTINKTTVRYGFSLSGVTVTYGDGDAAIIREINKYDYRLYTYEPNIVGSGYEIDDDETNVPTFGLDDKADWHHYLAGVYSYGDVNRAITISNVNHKNFIFELDATKVSTFTIERKELAISLNPQQQEYTGGAIDPTISAESFALTSEPADGDRKPIQDAVGILYVDSDLNSNGPSACGRYAITAELNNAAELINAILNNNYIITVAGNELQITTRTIKVVIKGFEGEQKYNGQEPEIKYEIQNIIDGHQDVVWANVTVTFNKTNELGIVWPNAGQYTISVQAQKVANADPILDNYTIQNGDPDNLIINKEKLTITYVSETKEYGRAPDAVLDYQGFVDGENASVLTKQPTVKFHRLAYEDPSLGWIPYPDKDRDYYKHINNYNGYINAGEWYFVASGAESANYTITYMPGKLTVTKKILNVTYNDLTLTYGDVYVEGLATSDNQYKITAENAKDYFTIDGYHSGGFVPSGLTDEYLNQADCYANVFGNDKVGYFSARPYDVADDTYLVGTHTITKDYFSFNFTNYEVNYSQGTLTIAPAALKLSIEIPKGAELENGEFAPLYYGDIVISGAEAAQEGDFKFNLDDEGFVYGEGIDSLTSYDTLGVHVSVKGYSEDVTSNGARRYLDAGKYEALVTKGLANWSDYSNNYEITAVVQEFEVSPKPLTITYKGGDVVEYNGTPQSPVDGISDYNAIWDKFIVSGFVNNDDYLAAETFADYDAFQQLRIATPVDEDTLDPIGDVRVDANGNVIPYLVKPTLPSEALQSIGNYAITFEAGEFTITPKDLGITINKQVRIYDATEQMPLSTKGVEYSFTEEDFCKAADKNNITARLTLVVDSAINAGSYEIVARLEGDATYARVTNYNLVVNDDSDSYLYINPRTIKVSYKNVNAIYGEITSGYNHTQNLDYENIIEGEDPIGVGAVLNAPLANDRNYVDAGTYTITPDIANIELLSANYVFSAEQCVEGQLVIAKKTLRVTVETIGVEARCTDDPCDDVHLEALTQEDFAYLFTAGDFAAGEGESNLTGKLYVANLQQIIDNNKYIIQKTEYGVDVDVDEADGNYAFEITDGTIVIVPTKSKYNLTYLQSLKDAGVLITNGSFVYNGAIRTMESSGLVIGDLEDLLAPEKIRENGDGGNLSLRFVYSKIIDANGNAINNPIPTINITDVGTYVVSGYFQNNDPVYKNVTLTLEATIVITARPVDYVIDGGLLEQIYGESDKHLNGSAESVEGFDESGLLSGQDLGVSVTLPANDIGYRPLGSYAITASYTNTNYVVTFKVRNANGDLVNLYDVNEDGVDDNQYYVVNPRPIEIALGYQTQVYNGSVAPIVDSTNFQEVGSFRILPDESADIVISIAPEDQVALYGVGSYDLVAVANNANYALTVVTYNVIEITTASINVNATIAEQIYDGAVAELVIDNQEVIGLKSGDALGTNVNVTYAVVGEAINAGDYEVTATIDNLNYVIGEFVTNGLTINKRGLTITLAAQASDYNNTIVKPDNSKYAAEGVADGETLTVTIRMVDANGMDIAIRDAGAYILTASYSVSNGIGDTTENYEVTVVESTYVVNRIAPELNVERLTSDLYGTYVYSTTGVVISTPTKKATSNSQGAITYSIFVDGQEPGAYTDGTTPVRINAGAYKLAINVAANGNYNSKEEIIDIVINKATPNIDFTQALARVYTYSGETQIIDGITHNNTDLDAVFEVTGNSFLDVPANGMQYVTAILKETTNYHAASSSVNIVINKATFDMSDYEFSGDVIRYGDKIIDAQVKGLPEGMQVSYKLNGADVVNPAAELVFKNAGTYVVEATYGFNRNNYYLPNELVSVITVVINKIEVSVTVANKSGFYGDKPQYDVANDVAIYGDMVEGDELDVQIKLDERESYPVGVYQVYAEATANDNYKLTVVAGTYTIIERNITVVADNKQVEYGTNVQLSYTIYYGHGAEMTTEHVGLVEGDQLSGRLDREPGTAVGDYTITGSFSNNNYNVEVQDGTYTIVAKDVTIVVYDQEGVRASDVNANAYKVIGLVRGDDLKIKVNGEIGTDPGTYALTATYDETNTNYNVTIQNGSFILRLLAQINVNNASLHKLYDGTPYVLDAVVTSGAPITYRLNGIDVENSFTEVGLYEILLTAPIHGDYAAPEPVRIMVEIRPQSLSTEVDGMHFIISTPEGFGALDEFKIVKTEDLSLSNEAYTSQINTAYQMYIVVGGVEVPVEEYLGEKEAKIKVKLSNDLVEQGAGAWLTDKDVNALNSSNTIDEDGYIELNAIGGSHVLLVTERASAVPIIIILSVIGVVAVMLFFMFLFRKKYIN